MRVVVHHARFGQEIADGLGGAFPDLEVRLNSDEASVPNEVERAEVLIGVRFPAGMLARATSLQWLQLTGVGADHVRDLSSSVTVTHAGAVPARAVAEHVMMAALCMGTLGLPSLPMGARRRRSLFGGCMVIVGLGRIGMAIAARARALGMRVVAVCRHERALPDVEVVTGRAGLLRAAGRADVLALAVPGTPETTTLIDAQVLAALPSSALLINVARAEVVDEAALVAALEQGRLAGALVDVHHGEPLAASSPLWSVPNLWVTPHCAYRYQDHAHDVVALCIDNMHRYRAGSPLLHAAARRATDPVT